MSNPKPTVAEIQEEISTSASDTRIQRLLNGACDLVETMTRREFFTSVETRYFDGNGKGYLQVDDFQIGSISRIAFLNADRSTGYLLATGNVATRGDEFPKRAPYHNRIDILNYTSENPYRIVGPSPYVFPRGTMNVEITANWGTYAVLPDALQNIIRDLTISKLTRPQGGIRSMSVGGESLSFGDSDLSQEQMNILELYTKRLVEID